MSRRPPNPAVDRAAQNQQTLKTLVKVESNKSCADCKRNKHPRWASWNLGVFVCIRCSGIHRGMGTHVSRVKSVDLDAWTDEQMQSMLRWGNARANKYWEAKLAPGHIPAEAKIENFIRTKYESRRWVMDGGMPDPATLDGGEGDDNVPLNVVQEKAKMERSGSQRASSTASQPQPIMKKPPQDVDFFGEMSDPVLSQRSNSAAPASTRTYQSPPSSAAPQKPVKTGDSLLGFDFFGPSNSNPPSRPSSAAASAASSGLPSRPDLKQSILSLYSRPSDNSSHSRTASASTNPGQRPSQSASSGLDDAFSGLNFSSPPPQSPPITSPKPAPFSNLASPTFKPSVPTPSSNSSARPPSIGTGSFFDSKPATTQTKPVEPSKPQAPRQQRAISSSSGFGDFGDFTSPEPPKPNPPAQSSSTNGMGDLFNITPKTPQPTLAQAAPRAAPPSASLPQPSSSPFNLSASKPAPAPQPPSQTSSNNAIGTSTASMVNMDPWGSDNVWASSNTAAATPASTTAPTQAQKAPPTTSLDFGGWSSGPANTASIPSIPAPEVKADEDFGGWESSAVPATTTSSSAAPKPGGGLGGSEDLFSNVWE